MDTCLNCGEDSVIWDNDYDFEDMGYEGKGIVHCYHCFNCGAAIEVRVPEEEEE